MKGRQGKNPFKGLYYYEEADKDIFHGRENESSELFDLVTLNGLTVVFGKSGIGKTSLLNAGLFPLLREKNFLPVKLRLDYSDSGLLLLDQVKQAIQKELKDHNIVEIEKGGSNPVDFFTEGETLWEYFHRVDHRDENEKPVTPVLVFDQFEELFTIGKHHAQRDALIDELYWLVEDQVPGAVKERILTHRETIPYLRSQAAVRVVFGLREDYLPHLNALKRRIPSIHRVLFRILHLNGAQAREVMDKSGAFQDEGIIQDILQQFYPADLEPGQSVPGEKLEVEPALLSLLCYQVFEHEVESLSIREKDAILSDFYDQILGQLPQGKELSEWIEKNLLTEGGFRTPRYLERTHPLREAVESAIDKKLLRKLYVGEKEHVEIIHDVLAPVIKERRNRRFGEKRKLELEKEKELRRKRVITTIIALTGIIAIFLAIFAFDQKNRADEQTKVAIIQKERADKQTQKTILEKNLKDEQRKIAEEKTKEAIEQRKKAEENELLAIKEKKRADEKTIEAISQKNRADVLYREAVSYRLAIESDLKIPTDNVKAIRIAEAAYKISKSYPPPAVVRALSAAAYSTLERPFYTTEFNYEGKIRTAVFSVDGSKILTASTDGTAKLWNLTGKSLVNLQGHTERVWSTVFSSDGSKILTASSDKTAKLWDNQGKLLANFEGHTDSVESAVFSPDGSKILTASWDDTAKLWGFNGKLLADLQGHTGNVTSAVFSPDGNKILTASDDNTAKMWGLKGKLLVDMKGHAGGVNSAVFSPDGSKILTASNDNTAKFWNLKGKLIANLKGHTGWVNIAVYSPDGSKILTASNDNTAKFWDLKGKLLTEVKGHPPILTDAVFSPDSSKIITTSWDKNAKLWDLQGHLLADMMGHTGYVINAVFSPDSSKILTASEDNTAKLWDLTGELLADLRHTSIVYIAHFSPDGSKILTASGDKTARLWDLSGKSLSDLKGHDGIVYSAVFSTESSNILTFSDDTTAKLWNLQGNLLADMQGHTDYVSGAAFSPDGKRIVTASADGTAIIWPTPGFIMEWLKTAPIPKLTQKEKEELGIADFGLGE